MRKTVLAGVALGGLSVPAIIAVLLAVDPIGEHRPGLGAVAALPPPAAGPVTRPTSRAPSRPVPPPQRPPASRAGRLDAGEAAAIVGRRFAGARVVEAELERERGVLTWEMTFLLEGAENEIRVDATTGTLSDHEVEDTDDDD
jgi:hypothetical protein